MSTTVVTQFVAAPADRVWGLLVDLGSRSAWLSTVDAVELVTPPPFAAGAIWRETHRMPEGDPVAEEFHVESCEPGRRFVVTSPGRGADYRTTYAVTPVTAGRHRGGTLVAVEQEGHPRSRGGRVLEVVLGGLAARTAEGAIRQELADLAAAAESAGSRRR
ncbi:SRPBCC family protein [Pilimelia columellifera]|uniref:Uncharacterized protein n=1 Tax=Pilimelia columellifera subsp. columellifera TaxID=706583 RepID=A0ABN3NFP6_9ACTN